MKDLINKNIKDCLLRMTIAFVIVMVSIPIWTNLNKENYSRTASYYESYNVYTNLSFIVK